MHPRSNLSILVFSLLATGLHASLAPSASDAVPLPVGAQLPAALVQTIEGTNLDLSTLVAGKPTVLIFYRGSWCPYCNRHLAALAEIEPELLKLGYQILALSPDAVTELKAMTGKNRLHYRLLSDRAMNAASAFGLAFRVDATTVKKYREYQIDLAPVPGEPDARWLPVPAVYLIGRDGLIKFLHSNPDYKARLSAEQVLAAAQAAL